MNIPPPLRSPPSMNLYSPVLRFKLSPFPEPVHDLVYGPVIHDVFQFEGDPIILKSDGFPTYHLANVVDDHLMEIREKFDSSMKPDIMDEICCC